MVPVGPLAPLGSGLATEAWTQAMLGLWQAGLWLLTVVLQLEDGLLTPDLSEDGPANEAYRMTFWLAGALVLVMLVIQLGLALLRRDGRSLAAAVWGCGKFVVVWAGWLTYGAAFVSLCGALTRGLLHSLLRVRGWGEWRPSLYLDTQDVTDATVATVLGLLGLVLWLAALGHLLILITRSATLIVLAAVTPIAAAGLVGEAGRSWFWRSVRWFHAAALTPVLIALLVGVGVQTTTGAAQGLADGPARTIGTALPGVVLVLMACFAPVGLFRLLAFVDPATPAGASFRQTVDSFLHTKALIDQQSGGPGRANGASAGDGSGGDDQRRLAAQTDLSASKPSTDAGLSASSPPEGGGWRFGGAMDELPGTGGPESSPAGEGSGKDSAVSTSPSPVMASGSGARGSAPAGGASGAVPSPAVSGGGAAAVPIVPV